MSASIVPFRQTHASMIRVYESRIAKDSKLRDVLIHQSAALGDGSVALAHRIDRLTWAIECARATVRRLRLAESAANDRARS